MKPAATLDAYLTSLENGGTAHAPHIAGTVRCLAIAAVFLRHAISDGLCQSEKAGIPHTENSDGDIQHELDLDADDLFLNAARKAGLAYYASEEQTAEIVIDPSSPLAIAIDPLDGSSNIKANLSIGTIFSILPNLGDPVATFLQQGSRQLAAGFFIYGPQLSLVLTTGRGTSIFTFSQKMGTFVESVPSAVIPQETAVFSINASNYRHWDTAVRSYVDDCLQGQSGVRSKNFNMRWNASLVAEAYRILIHGGVFLYPRDERRGYKNGRLRIAYEANPISMLIEQAGGASTDGTSRILDITPSDLHERVPLIFGSREEVATVARYHIQPSAIGARHPLFGHRGLFRA